MMTTHERLTQYLDAVDQQPMFHKPRRTERLQIRLTMAELNLIRCLAGDRNIGSLIRKLTIADARRITGGTTPPREASTV